MLDWHQLLVISIRMPNQAQIYAIYVTCWHRGGPREWFTPSRWADQLDFSWLFLALTHSFLALMGAHIACGVGGSATHLWLLVFFTPSMNLQGNLLSQGICCEVPLGNHLEKGKLLRDRQGDMTHHPSCKPPRTFKNKTKTCFNFYPYPLWFSVVSGPLCDTIYLC